MPAGQQEAGEGMGKGQGLGGLPRQPLLSPMCTFLPCCPGGHLMPTGKSFVPRLRDRQEGMRKQKGEAGGKLAGEGPSRISCQPLGHDSNLPLTSRGWGGQSLSWACGSWARGMETCPHFLGTAAAQESLCFHPSNCLPSPVASARLCLSIPKLSLDIFL